MTWNPGREVILRLLAEGSLTQTFADEVLTEELISQAEKSIEAAELVVGIGALHTAYAAAWEGCRKALTALLQTQGLRPNGSTNLGGHRTVQEATAAQFGGCMGAILAPVPMLRQRRNDLEYPDTDTVVEVDEVVDAIAAARAVVEAARTILDRDVLTVFHAK